MFDFRFFENHKEHRKHNWFLFDFFLKKLLLRTIFENKENIFFVFSKNFYCSLNLVFSMFLCFS